ncbi:MAG: adenosine deaminase [Bacteroidetes bacterium]|nr:adenosine deaminase [Bacteroidota bacterium]
MKQSAIAIILTAILSSAVYAQPSVREPGVSSYFESIRSNEAELRAFFHRMPKGGDLHHHFSGAIYAETFFDTAAHKHYSLDTSALVIYPPGMQPSGVRSVVSFDSMSVGKRSYFKDRLIRLWSVKDFTPCSGAPDAHFFATFNLFGPAIWGSEAPMLQEIKRRAIAEHTSYIESMLIRPSMPSGNAQLKTFFSRCNEKLWRIEAARDTGAALDVLSMIFDSLRYEFGADKLAANHHAMLVGVRDASALPDGLDSLVTVRFLNYVTRVSPPADVFGQLYLSFASCDMDSLVMGVNIVAPENADVSMNDYWLHMVMFHFMRTRFPKVHVSMHAGELVPGMVKPEDLTWHISSAVDLAGAERIGHGVDIASETKNYELLDEMAKRHVTVEINLTSNEFILGVKNSTHPVTLYADHHVPIVISTDDPGVLRSDHTMEFVKLAMRYPRFSYADIKQFVYNSIDYSFLTPRDKATERGRLDRAFREFESTITHLH